MNKEYFINRVANESANFDTYEDLIELCEEAITCDLKELDDNKAMFTVYKNAITWAFLYSGRPCLPYYVTKLLQEKEKSLTNK